MKRKKRWMITNTTMMKKKSRLSTSNQIVGCARNKAFHCYSISCSEYLVVRHGELAACLSISCAVIAVAAFGCRLIA